MAAGGAAGAEECRDDAQPEIITAMSKITMILFIIFFYGSAQGRPLFDVAIRCYFSDESLYHRANYASFSTISHRLSLDRFSGGLLGGELADDFNKEGMIDGNSIDREVNSIGNIVS